MDAVRAYQREEAGEKRAARGSGALAHHAGEFSALNDEKGRAEHKSEGGENQETPWLPPFGGQRPEPACVAREQQTHRLDKDIAEIEQLGPSRSAGGVTRQYRVGGEQPREQDKVAEQKDPEPIGDDGTRRGRSATAASAREFDW